MKMIMNLKKALPLLLLLALATSLRAQPRDSLGTASPARDSAAAVDSCRIILAPHTNLLLPLVNAGIEVPLSRTLSLDATMYFPWIGHDRENTWCFEAMAATLELRWWIAPRTFDGLVGNTLAGHSLALGAFGGHADFERNRHGFQAEAYGCYLDYTFSMPVSERLLLSFSFSAGYARVPWRDYDVYEGSRKLVRHRPVLEHVENYIGPLKAAVTLSIPITVKPREGRNR